MDDAQYSGLRKFKLFLALSRTPHGLLDICTPLFVALLWLGYPPDTQTILLGTIAAFAGYTAVYALNDIVDYRSDQEKIRQQNSQSDAGYLDAAFVRHPLARGYLRMSDAVLWAGGWAMVSLIAATLLNPICALILIAGCILEAIYCLLLRVTHLRTLVSGVVKTLGGLAAIFAVDPSPDAGLLLLIFFWLFFWEIGGQNVPADWHDIQQDASMQAKTVPVSLGPKTAGVIVLVTQIISLILSGILFLAAPLRLQFPFYMSALLLGGYLLIIPAFHLFKTREKKAASILFNRASWYPCILLIISVAALIWQRQ